MGDMKELLEKKTHSLSTIVTWTVGIHFSSVNSVVIFLSRVVKSLILCRWEVNSTTKTEEWTQRPAWGKRLLKKKYKKHV